MRTLFNRTQRFEAESNIRVALTAQSFASNFIVAPCPIGCRRFVLTRVKRLILQYSNPLAVQENILNPNQGMRFMSLKFCLVRRHYRKNQWRHITNCRIVEPNPKSVLQSFSALIMTAYQAHSLSSCSTSKFGELTSLPSTAENLTISCDDNHNGMSNWLGLDQAFN